jgi:hypothetical protein
LMFDGECLMLEVDTLSSSFHLLTSVFCLPSPIANIFDIIRKNIQLSSKTGKR